MSPTDHQIMMWARPAPTHGEDTAPHHRPRGKPPKTTKTSNGGDVADDYCELNDMPASMCAHCRGVTLDDPAPTIAYRFDAMYGGRCASCDKPFSEGDRIGYTTDGYYVCPTCTDRMPDA